MSISYLLHSLKNFKECTNLYFGFLMGFNELHSMKNFMECGNNNVITHIVSPVSLFRNTI